MATVPYTFTLVKGKTFQETLLLQQGPGVSAPAVNLTGYSAKMQVRSAKGASTALLELSTENGRIVTTPLEGRIDLTVSETDLRALSFSSGVFDLVIKSPSGVVDVILSGVVVVDTLVTLDV